MTETKRIVCCLGAASVLALASACSKSDADVAVNEVIVTDTPVARSSVWVDPSLKDGKAEWHPFRVPEDKPPVDAKSAAKGAAGKGDAAGGVEAEASKQIEEDLRGLVKDYNDLIGEGKLEDALEYWVKPQQEMVKQVSASLSKAKEALQKVAEALNAKLPDGKDRVAKAVAAVDASLSLKLQIDSIQAKSGTEAEGFRASNPTIAAQRFKKVEEDWYLEVPEELASAFVAAAEKIAPMFDAIATALQGGAPAEQIVQQLETMGAMIGGPAKPADDAKPDSETKPEGS